MKRIVLIGMMGSGKTTVGKLLAERTGWRYVDNDDAVRTLTDRDPTDIIAAGGEQSLHDAEAAALLQALGVDEPAIIGAAAWVVLQPDCQAALRLEPNVAERGKPNGAALRETLPPTASGTAIARLEIFFRETYLQNFDLPLGRAIVGRTPDNDLQIRSKFISRHHAQIVTSVDRCVLEDLNSTNGIFLLSKRVKHHVLRDGDVVQLGEHKLVYRD
jgi:hypothetical protein